MLDDPPGSGAKKRSAYKKLGTKRESIFTGFGLMDPAAHSAYARARDRGITGNLLVGDGLQQGATLVILPGGEVVFQHIQEKASDHPHLEELRTAAVAAIQRYNTSKADGGTKAQNRQ